MADQSILIVGAGIAGAATALELSSRGYKVSLFDPGPLPHPLASSTDISKVVRMDYGDDELYMGLMEDTFPLWRSLNKTWGQELYHETGYLVLSRDSMDKNGPGSFEYDSYHTLLKRGHHPERLTPEQLKARFPMWYAEHYPDGYHNPVAGWAESGNVVMRMVGMARDAGTQLHEGKKVTALVDSGSRVIGIKTADGEIHRADYTIVAAGAWTPTLLPHLSDVMWATGHPVFHFKPENPDLFRPPHFLVWAADIARTGWYGFPANANGVVKIANHGTGKRLDADNGERTLYPGEEDRFREFLRYTFPALADAPAVYTRLCLYCDTWDGNLWIDHDPDRPGLIVCAGDSGHGFKFGPSLGKITADVLERKPNKYAPRFAWRRRGDLTSESARAGIRKGNS